MPTLDWIGKQAVVNHHREVPFHLLKSHPSLSAGNPDSGNLLLQGDNLLALKALLPYYASQVKCIYIDPPYNTGNENWVYNDNVNASEIKKWLGKTVGHEAEDLSRHDKWLCMMYPRLQLLHQMLRQDGAIFISIDDMEFHRLKLIMDEIFQPQNWICTLIWKRRQTPDSRNLNGVSADHEYVLAYGRTSSPKFLGQAKDLTKYTNPDNDPNGPWMSDNLTGLANAKERPNLHYEVTHPTTGQKYPPHPSRGWIYGPDRMAELVAKGRILWPKSKTGRPRLKRFLTDMKNETTGFSTFLEAPANVAATKELAELLGTKSFAFPKPSDFIRILIEQVTDKDSLILDSFAGSGTTGHAVMKLNAADGGHRRFILIEMEPTIAQSITAQRLLRVLPTLTATPSSPGIAIPGSTPSPNPPRIENQKSKIENPPAPGFQFCTLAEPLFDQNGQINTPVKFPDLARHVFFSETGRAAEKAPTRKSPLIGVHNHTAYYLLFNGILGDKSLSGGNVLTNKTLALLPHPLGPNHPRVIFAEASRLSAARLARELVTFKQLPYELKTT